MTGRGATARLKDQAGESVPTEPVVAPGGKRPPMRFHRWARYATPLALLSAGCGVAPKHFRKISDPAPIVRARSVSLGSKLPQNQVLPALIDRLEDRDPVVRLAAFEELKKGTGRSFGFVPWAGESERAGAVSRWRAWWKERQAALVGFVQKP
jgi:hypothetical protein